MEPLGIAASIIALVDTSQKTVSRLISLPRNEGIPRPRNLDSFASCTQLMEDLSKILTTQQRELPNSAQSTLKLCLDNALGIDSILIEFHQRSTSKKSSAAAELRVALRKPELQETSTKIENRIQDFVEQIQVFLGIVNTDATLHMTREMDIMNLYLQRAQVETMQLKEEITKLVTRTPLETPSSQEQDQHELLRRAAERINAELAMYEAGGARRDYTFTATVIYEGNEDCENVVVCGIMDSGSPDDWISKKVVERASMTSQIKPLEVERVYTGFEGGTFQPSGRIELTWFSVNKAKSKRTEFLIHDTGPFDMVLGAPSIEMETVQMFKEPALVLRHANLSKVELTELERKASEKKDGQKDLAAIRKAKDAMKRESQRQKKVVSRLITPTHSLSRRTSVLSQVSHPLRLGSSLRRQPSDFSIQTYVTETAYPIPATTSPTFSADGVEREENPFQPPNAPSISSSTTDGNLSTTLVSTYPSSRTTLVPETSPLKHGTADPEALSASLQATVLEESEDPSTE